MSHAAVIAHIEVRVAGHFGVPVAALHARCREARFAWPRQVVMFAAHGLGIPLGAIARHFQRVPGTVSYAASAVRERLDSDRAERARLKPLLESLQA